MPFSEVFIRRVLAAISDYCSNKLTYQSKAAGGHPQNMIKISELRYEVVFL